MRKKLRKRILVFSLIMAFVSIILAAIIFSVFKIILPYREMEDTNRGAFERIHCSENICDNRDLINDWSFQPPDYILTKDIFFIWNENYSGFWLNFSDTFFVKEFREPTTKLFPSNETWRLYSKSTEISGKKVEVIVGVIEDASWLLYPTPAPPEADKKLKEEADTIISRLKIENSKIVSLRINSNADGYQVINVEDGEVIDWSIGIPAYFPSDQKIKNNFIFMNQQKDVFLVRTDYGENLIATSLYHIGSLRWLSIGILLIFIFVFLLSYIVGLTFLKKYFIFARKNPPSISEALKSGEGQEIEFKRGLVDEDLLKSIIAFANTNDGTIFVGIDDQGKIEGLELKTPKERERFVHQIFNLIRNKIKPSLFIRIDFETLREYIVAKIFIPRGEEPLYYMDGVIYVRHGDSDIKPEPELVKKILADFSF